MLAFCYLVPARFSCLKGVKWRRVNVVVLCRFKARMWRLENDLYSRFYQSWSSVFMFVGSLKLSYTLSAFWLEMYLNKAALCWNSFQNCTKRKVTLMLLSGSCIPVPRVRDWKVMRLCRHICETQGTCSQKPEVPWTGTAGFLNMF